MSLALKQSPAFSWIPIYTELAQKVLPYRSRQTELIKMFHELLAKGTFA